MYKIIKYVISDLFRNRTILLYTALLIILSCSIFSMEDSHEKGLISLLNIILFVVPLVGMIFSSIYLYNSGEFIELLVSQPLKRETIWKGIYVGLSATLCTAYLLGVGIPVLLFSATAAGYLLIAMGVMLTFIFVSIALLASVRIRDKAKGIGITILLWLYFAMLFDAAVLFILFQFSDYPIENLMIGISMLNPIDISRIFLLLHLEVSAMMGYTGAIFREFFGTLTGMCVTLFIMFLWIVLPLWGSLLHFKKKDL